MITNPFKKYTEDYFLHLKVLQYLFGGNILKARYIHELSRRLSTQGFEKYSLNLINKTYGINIIHTGRLNESDGGLDGVDFDNHVYLQSKKYIIGTTNGYKGKVSVNEVKDFIASILIAENNQAHGSLEGFFVTTGFFTNLARDVASSTGIECIDFSKLYDLSEIYCLKDFEKKYKDQNLYKSYQLMLHFEEVKNSKEVLSRYLKSVRENLCLTNYGNDTDNGKIFTDSTLNIFIEKYTGGLKKDFSDFKSFRTPIQNALEIWES